MRNGWCGVDRSWMWRIITNGKTCWIFHQKEDWIEAHVFVAYLADCLHVTLQVKLRQVAGGLTPRTVLKKFAMMQMMYVFFPTEEPGKELLFRRYTQPEKDHQMLLAQLD